MMKRRREVTKENETRCVQENECERAEREGNKKQEHEEKNIRKQTPPTHRDNM